jgi:hypothetical protein
MRRCTRTQEAARYRGGRERAQGIGAGQSEGPEPRNVATVRAPTHDRSRWAEHCWSCICISEVYAPHRG